MTGIFALVTAQGGLPGLPGGFVRYASAVLFFAVTIYMMGLAVVQLATGRYRLSLETHLMCTGVGLAVFAVMTVVLNTFGFSLTWWSFLLSACGLFVVGALRDILAKEVSKEARKVRPLWTKDSWYLIAAVGMTVMMLLVFLHGTFFSPWLTDDDSWQHAVSAKYVATQGTYSMSVDVRLRRENGCYLEPYPPSYAVLMGVLHQIAPSVSWTLKFFNAVIVSLGILYFYVMVRQWTQDPVKALWMTGVLWVTPCFMSGFIWAQSMALVMFFPAFWAFERAREAPRWNIVGAIVVTGICLTQPSTAAVFVMMAVVYCVVNVTAAKLRGSGEVSVRGVLMQTGAIVCGGLLSLGYYVPQVLKFGWDGFVRGITGGGAVRLMRLGGKVSGVGRGIYYGLWDFIWAPASTKINQPTGIGLVLFAVAAAGVVLTVVRWRSRGADRRTVLVLTWLVLTVMGVLAEYLPVSLFPHRFWAFMAIPMAMIAGEFLWFASSGLSGRYTVLAVSLGAVLGLAMGLGGLCEAVYAMKPAVLEGLRLLTFVLAVLASGAGVATALYLLVQNGESQRTWWRFVGVTVLVTGIALTSGFVKTHFQGFALWDPGLTFYSGPAYYVRGEDGQMQLTTSESSNDLWGYVILKHASVPNLPVLGLTARDGQIIGFDLGTPPFNEQIRQLREEVSTMMDRAAEIHQETSARLAEKGLPQAEADAIRKRSAARIAEVTDDLLTRIHGIAVAHRFRLITVDHTWAALESHWRRQKQSERIQLIRKAGIQSLDQLQDLLAGRAAPTPLEAEYLDEIRVTSERIQQALNNELKAATKAKLLRDLLDASPLFKRRDITAVQRDGSQPDLSRFGVTVFSVEEKPEEQPAE